MRIALILFILVCVPVLPFLLFGSYLEPFVEAQLQQEWLAENPVAIFLLVVATLTVDILLPIPSSFVGTLAGQVLGVGLGSLATWIGLNASCVLGYWLASRFGWPFIRVFSKAEAMTDVERLVENWGISSLVVCRAVPVLAEASVLLAGLGKMQLHRFWPVVLAGNLGLALAYAALGSYSSQHGWLGFALAISVAIPVALFTLWVWTKRASTSKESQNP